MIAIYKPIYLSSQFIARVFWAIALNLTIANNRPIFCIDSNRPTTLKSCVQCRRALLICLIIIKAIGAQC